jgi:cytochrome c-type biogenesis protein CcmI
MNWFIVISALLLIFVLIFLLRPLLRKSDQVGDGNEARAVSLSILREQQAELERELANGRIDKTAYDQAADELERRTLEDVGGSAATPSGSSRRPRTALVLGLCLPAAVAALYFTIGEPSVLEGKASRPPLTVRTRYPRNKSSGWLSAFRKSCRRTPTMVPAG